MAAIYQSIDPAVNARVDVDSVITIQYDSSLKTSTVVDWNIIFEQITADDGDELRVPVPFTVSNSPQTQIILTPDDDLSYDSLYEISLSSNILAAVDDAPITARTFQYLTVYKSEMPESNLTNDGNPVDVYRKSLQLNELLDVEKIIEDGSKFNYSFAPSVYDPISKTYSYAGSDKIEFDLQTFFKDQLRSQLLSTFGNYFDSLRGFDDLSETLYQQIEEIMFLRSFDVNTSTGLLKKIQYFIERFAQATGKYFVAVAPDPLKPFVYYISTDMSKDYWAGVIKEIVHPLGWQEVYSEIDPYTTDGLQLVGTAGDYVTANRITDTFTLVGHEIKNGTIIKFRTTGTLPRGLSADISYYIINAENVGDPQPPNQNTFKDTFQVSLTEDGEAAVFTSNGTGNLSIYTHQYYQVEKYQRTEEDLLGSKVISYSGSSGFIDTVKDAQIITVYQDFSDESINGLALSKMEITSGNNAGVYTIVESTNNAIENEIKIFESFHESESSPSYEIYKPIDSIRQFFNIKVTHDTLHYADRATYIRDVTSSGTSYVHSVIDNYSPVTTRRDLLNVLNSLDWKSRFVDSYLTAKHASALADVSDTATVSRLTIDAAGVLGLLVVPYSSIKDFSKGDGSFFYDDKDNTTLWFESDTFQTSEFGFGNVVLYNGNTEYSETVHTGATEILDIVSLTSSVDGLQKVTLNSNIIGIEATHQIKFTGLDTTKGILNNTYYTIAGHDYVAKTIEIENPLGSAQTAGTSGISGIWMEPVHHTAITFTLPGEFSYDFYLWGGYAIFFGQHAIDPMDYYSEDSFLYRYAEYTALIDYPDDDGYVNWAVTDTRNDWVASNDYSLGDYIVVEGDSSKLFLMECTDDQGSSGITEPDWYLEIVNVGDTVIDGGIYTGVEWTAISIIPGGWLPANEYDEGDLIIETGSGSIQYVLNASRSGKSGIAEPVWASEITSTSSTVIEDGLEYYTNFLPDLDDGEDYQQDEYQISNTFGGGTYDQLMVDANSYPSSDFSRYETTGIFKKYTFTVTPEPPSGYPPNIETWESGNYIYEYNASETDLISFWTMDDIAGTTVSDEMGNNDGYLSNATQVDGYIGYARHFGRNQYISVTASASLEDLFVGGASISLRVNHDESSTVDQEYTILNRLDSPTSPTEGWRLYIKNSKLYFYAVTGGDDGEWVTDDAVITPAQYDHIVLKYNSSLATSTPPVIHVNNSTVALTELSTPSSNTHADNDDLFMGAFSTSTGFLYGSIDQLRIYDRLLTDTEVTYLYNYVGDASVNEPMGAGRFFGIIESYEVDDTDGSFVFRFLNDTNDESFDSSMYYTTIANRTGDVEAGCALGNEMSYVSATTYNRKWRLGYNVPDFNYYQWSIWDDSGTNLVTGWTDSGFSPFTDSTVDISDAVGTGVAYSALTVAEDTLYVISFDIVDPATSGVLDVDDLNFVVSSDTALTADKTVDYDVVEGHNVKYFRASATDAYCGFIGTNVDFGVDNFKLYIVNSDTDYLDQDNQLTLFGKTGELYGVMLGVHVDDWKIPLTLTTITELTFDGETETITRTDGDWEIDGLTINSRVSIVGSSNNDRIFTVTGISGAEITVTADTVTRETVTRVKEMSEIVCLPNTSHAMHEKHFFAFSSENADCYAFWFNDASGSYQGPATLSGVTVTPVEIAINDGDTAENVRDALVAEIGDAATGLTDFEALADSVNSGKLTIECTGYGTTNQIVDGTSPDDTGFTINRLATGEYTTESATYTVYDETLPVSSAMLNNESNGIFAYDLEFYELEPVMWENL